MIKKTSSRRVQNRVILCWPLIIYSLLQLSAINLKPTTNNQQQEATTESQQYESQKFSSSSAESKISHPELLLPSSSSLLFSSSFAAFKYFQKASNDVGRFFFGRQILLAVEAASTNQQLQQQSWRDKEIVGLDITNFNTELIQYKHPFQHINFIQYCVSYSKWCLKFKETYTQLAKEIFPWRNVIRPSSVDLAMSTNTPIAHSWSIKTIPTLRFHPPPSSSLAQKLNRQLSSLSSSLAEANDKIQDAMFMEYNNSQLFIHSLDEVQQYTDNVQLLKTDILAYINRYVQHQKSSSKELPETWPNLSPVTESNLVDLCRHHPRQELFLIIEPNQQQQDDESETSKRKVSLAFRIMLQLSSSSAWKAVRYVRAANNRALIEDVISQKRKKISVAAGQQSTSQEMEQVKLLQNFLINPSSSSSSESILLVHIDDSHSPIETESSSPAFHFMTIVTAEQIVKKVTENHVDFQDNTYLDPLDLLPSSSILDLSKLSDERKIQLVANYVKQTYTSTSEDRNFVRSLDAYIHNRLLSNSNDDKSVELVDAIAKRNPIKNTSDQDSDFSSSQDQPVTVIDKLYKAITNSEQQSSISKSTRSQHFPGDYDDKIKAIRYILFNEIHRTSLVNATLSEQLDKLNVLINLITVIKTYFPLPDSSSIEFIDGVHNYLLKQQSELISASSGGRTTDNSNHVVDHKWMRKLKLEMERLELAGKSLPEIKKWKHCASFPCALWRLFHSLSAFEYEKLNQIKQLSQHHQQHSASSTGLHQSDNLSPSMGAITMRGTVVDSSAPVEHLVSSPSTTTSLSLTIATSAQSSDSISGGGSNSAGNNHNHNNNIMKPLTEADLPMPVLLVMRDYITSFFSCQECREHFQLETADLSLEKIRREAANFSILWLWETHNRVNKRLSVDLETNPPERPKIWFPSFEQCETCYKKPPSFLKQSTTTDSTIFHESIEWNEKEILAYLLREYTKQPLDNLINLFGYQITIDIIAIIGIIALCLLILSLLLRYGTDEMICKRRQKVTLLNGNGNANGNHCNSLELH